MANRVSRALVLADDKRTSRFVEKLDNDVTKQIAEADALGMVVEHELARNMAVIGAAAAMEMAAADRMIQRAGSSRVAQTIAADRINRLIQTNDRTLGRNGF